MTDYSDCIRNALSKCLIETDYHLGPKYRGKVRDVYDLTDSLLIITTDRQSAFDRILASVPFKGQVLNLISAWWFKKTRHIVPNHLLSVPAPNATLAKKCTVFPIEFIVRGYITGTTQTSIWTNYQQGVRQYCGHTLLEGLKKNQKLPQAILTPTTKEALHDRLITPEEIIQEKLMTAEEWAIASEYALRLFEFGVETAKRQGLILVDTKYEMGRDEDGRIILVDELHTPDSSRYWLAESYETQMAQGKEPENIDKEFLRLWFVEHCDPYQEGPLPEAPEALVVTLSNRYIQLYELITGHAFPFLETPATINLQGQNLMEIL
jgi:phosphoribosylaminoimidazole-succinocarboxamide synthase